MSATKKLDSRSASACHSGLEFFSVPPTQVSINRTHLKEILPLNSTNESPFEFRLFSDSNFIDLSKTYLYLKLSIQKNGQNGWVAIEDADQIAPVQSIGTSFIKQMRVSISGNEIFDSSNLYPYLAYIKNELNYSKDYKDTVLSTIGYYRDDTDPDNAGNDGHLERMALCNAGRTFETYTKVDFDLSGQNQFLLNNLDVLFTFYQSDDRFLLKTYNPQDANQYRLRVHSIKMFVRSVEVQPSVSLAVMRMLEKETAKYSTRKLQIRPTYLSQGRTEVTQNCFSSVVPRRIIVALVDNRAYTGDFRRSPFNFKPYDLREISVNAGGVNYPLVPFNANFSNAQDSSVMRLFSQMHESCALGGQQTNGIDLERFRSGSTFFVLPLNSTLDDCEGFELIHEGVTSVRLQFRTPLPEAVTMLVIGEFDSMLQIDRNRVVVTDGTV